MDEGKRALLVDFRFGHEEEHQHSSPDSGKKRKFQQEYLSLTLPLSKQKFRDRPCSTSSSSHGSSSAITQLESDETSEGSMTSDMRQHSRGSPTISNSRDSSEKPVPCSPSYEEILTEAVDEVLETYDDYFGDIPQASIEEQTTYSTDVTSDISLYFSPRWGARLGSRRPTIDEEFERYFSALML